VSTSPQLIFQLRPGQYYGCLTLESLLAQQPAIDSGIDLGRPPIPSPILDLSQGTIGQNPGQVTHEQLVSALNTSKFSKPWTSWFVRLLQFLTQGSAEAPVLEVVAPSVDETDTGWFGNGTINASDDPVTFTATLTSSSRFGLQARVSNPGSGYGSAPTLTLTDANGNTNGAALVAAVSGGFLDSVTVTNSGYGLVAPLSVAISGGGGSGGVITADIGRQWQIGDFIVWNDPTIPSGKNYYSYEIDQITNIVFSDATHATFTLQRARNEAPTGEAQYGSLLAAHTSKNFYRLINKGWIRAIDAQLGPQVILLPWPNMTVAAVVVGQAGQSAPILTNLAPTPFLPGTSTRDVRTNPSSLGMRTMNGAAYCTLGITGNLSVGATSQARISAQAWEGIRCVYAKVLTAPVGAVSFNGDADASIVIYVCFIAPDGTVGLIDTLVIDTTKFNSYSTTNVPDGRQMPYHFLFQRTAPNTDWPPNQLPTIAGALTVGGSLQLGTPPNLPNTPSGTTSVQFSPDGAIDFIIAQVGSTTPGANLTVTVQT